MKDPGFDTLCAHAGEDRSRFLGAAAPPIYQASLFMSPDIETFANRHNLRPEVYDYTRSANPTTDVLEAKVAALERTAAARSFGSGMAAVAAAIMHCVSAGDHVVAVDTVYGPTRALLTGYLSRFGIAVTFVPGTDAEDFRSAAQPNTRLFYLESPSSMVFALQDLRAVADIASALGITTVIDNSWASPYFQNPTDHGIDLVVHSATKYLGGHSDIVAGIVAGSEERIGGLARSEGGLIGGILDPFGAWLIIRGIRTLPIRMERHQQTAIAVAKYLHTHPRVANVHYPGLSSHPQYELGQRQMRGHSGLLSFELDGGTREMAGAVLDKLHYFGLAVSWGGFESLAVPAAFPHASGGTPRWGARLHIGLEDCDDLVEDLDQALHL